MNSRGTGAIGGGSARPPTHAAWFARLLLGIGAGCLACAATAPPPTATLPAAAAASSSSTAGPVLDEAQRGASERRARAIDRVFDAYRQRLPEPADMSEMNGASLVCERHGTSTYNLIAAAAAKVPIDGDADLPTLVAWMRDPDPCIRQIAIDALLPRIHLDPDRLSLPDMHDPEHHQFHAILVSLKRYLDARGIAYRASVFDGLALDLRREDFASLRGNWEQEVTSIYNFQYLVEIDAEHIRVTRRKRDADPAWPDHTVTTKIDGVVVDDRSQWVVSGQWSVESNAKGYRGKPQPTEQPQRFWPVGKDIVWLHGPSADWIKLRRARK